MLIKKIIYSVSDLYIGFSFDTGRVLPLLKDGDSSPDQWFGKNQQYIDLTGKEWFLWTNDSGEDMSNCGNLFCVRPFSNYVSTTKYVSFVAILVMFKGVIPKFLEDQYVVDKIFEILEQYKTSASKEELSEEYYQEYMNIIYNLEDVIRKYRLAKPDENNKSFKKE